MKKFLLSTLACAALVSASAEGYQVNVQSAKQTGMGHTGVAQKLGAESQHFNPAGMAFMQNKFDVSLGASAIYAQTSYTNIEGQKTENDVSPSTPLYAYFSYKLSDKLAAGLSLTTPYGSSLDWADEWDGDGLVQSISLQTFSLQPTIAYQLCERLSLGAGLIVSWGSVNLSRNLDTSNVINIALEGKSEVAYGYNLGLMYDINERLSFGASYRSKMKLKVESGDLALKVADPSISAMLTSAQMLPASLATTFASQMPMPANLTLGVSYKLSNRLLMAFDFQQTYWSAYESLDIEAHSPLFGQSKLISEKNYRNSFALRLGAEYSANDNLDLRAGVYFDESPIPSTNLNPETPGMDKLGFSLGASYRPIECLSIDLTLLYIAGLSRYGSIEYDTIDLSKLGSVTQTFEGDYTTNAFAPTLGLNFSF